MIIPVMLVFPIDVFKVNLSEDTPILKDFCKDGSYSDNEFK